jgi:AcrR family transcriptional regulator
MMLDSTSVKGRILDAAARAFATHGVDQTSIDDIARDLGATKGKIYHHFGSKSELVCAIRKQSVQLTLERVRPQFDAAMPPPEKFHAMAKAHVIAMISELAYHRVVVEEMRGSKTGGATPAGARVAPRNRRASSGIRGLLPQHFGRGHRQRAFS